MGELLGAFAFASDLAFGLNLEDSLKSCFVATRLAEQMNLGDDDRLTVYYGALLNHAGCTSWTSELASIWQADEIVARRELILFTDRSTNAGLDAWMRRYVAPSLPLAAREAHLSQVMQRMPEVVYDAIVSTAEASGRIARRLGMPASVRQATRHSFEQFDGGGAPDGLSGRDIPIASRIILPAFIIIPTSQAYGLDNALAALEQGSGTTFDPEVIEALDRLLRTDGFWSSLEGGRIRERVLALEPSSQIAEVDEERLDDIAFAFADFIDLKSRFAGAHSRRTAAAAEQVARLMDCAPESVVEIRRAALLHDLGLVAVPSFSLEMPADRLSESEWEQYRLHPYHGERILQRVPALAKLAPMVGNHEERVDGTGFYRGLSGRNISLGARIIAVAARLDELTHDGPGRQGTSFDDALDILRSDSGMDRSIVDALSRATGDRSRPPETARAAGLTDRELDVLRLAARGMTRAQIGGALGVTESTARHHLEHIYNKIGTSTRVGATLFAIENNLLN